MRKRVGMSAFRTKTHQCGQGLGILTLRNGFDVLFIGINVICISAHLMDMTTKLSRICQWNLLFHNKKFRFQFLFRYANGIWIFLKGLIILYRVLARIPKLAVQKFFWEWPNITVGVVALKVFWDVATETVAIKHMCWSDKAIIVFLNRGFRLLTSVLYARIIIMVHKHGEFVYAQISHIQAYLTCF